MMHHLKALRYDSCVTRGSHIFTCHPPHTNQTCLYSPAARHHRPLAGTNLYCLVNRGTQVWETCPGFLRRVPGRDSKPRPLDPKSDTLPTAPRSHLLTKCWLLRLLIPETEIAQNPARIQYRVMLLTTGCFIRAVLTIYQTVTPPCLRNMQSASTSEHVAWIRFTRGCCFFSYSIHTTLLRA